MKRTDSRPDVSLARRIAAYLLQHPQGADTAEGIAVWWLMQQEIRWSLAEVQAALNVLADRGWLSARESGGRKRYGLNAEHLAEVEAFVKRTAAARRTRSYGQRRVRHPARR